MFYYIGSIISLLCFYLFILWGAAHVLVHMQRSEDKLVSQLFPSIVWAISLSGTWCTYWASLVALDNHQKEQQNSFLKHFLNLTYFLFVCVSVCVCDMYMDACQDKKRISNLLELEYRQL